MRHLEQVLVLEAEVPVVLGHQQNELHGGPLHVVVLDDLVHAGGQVPAYAQAIVLHEPEDALVGVGDLSHQAVHESAIVGVDVVDEGGGQHEVQHLPPPEEPVPVRHFEYVLNFVPGKVGGEESLHASDPRREQVFVGENVPRHVDRLLVAQVEEPLQV